MGVNLRHQCYKSMTVRKHLQMEDQTGVYPNHILSLTAKFVLVA